MGKKLVILLLIFSLVALAACSVVPALQEKAPDAGGQGTPDTTGSTESVPQAQSTSPAAVSPPTGETTKITLYFADPSGQYLVPVSREIPKVEGIARATVQELILGPESGTDLLATIPVGTALRDINIRPDGLAVVDFTRELVENHAGGTTGEMLTVYSIVNTVSQFPTVKKVQLLVDGQYQQTLAGHLDIREALARNDSLILPK